MPRNKDPAVLFYTSDFLVGVMGLTMAERGQYITLLCMQHQKGHLSAKDIELAVGKVSPDVLKKFETDEDGNYYNYTMEEAIERRSCYIESRRKNGSKGGRPEKPYAKPYAKPYGKPTQNHSENENENITEDKDITKNNISFSFSNTTTTTTTDTTTNINKDSMNDSSYSEEKAADGLESTCGYPGDVTGKPVGYYGITDDEERWIFGYFIENELKSNPREFIAYNASRGWRGIGGENVRAHLVRYILKWERDEE